MQTRWARPLRKAGGLSCTTCCTRSRHLTYSSSRRRKPRKCSAVRMEPGTASAGTRAQPGSVAGRGGCQGPSGAGAGTEAGGSPCSTSSGSTGLARWASVSRAALASRSPSTRRRYSSRRRCSSVSLILRGAGGWEGLGTRRGRGPGSWGGGQGRQRTGPGKGRRPAPEHRLLQGLQVALAPIQHPAREVDTHGVDADVVWKRKEGTPGSGRQLGRQPKGLAWPPSPGSLLTNVVGLVEDDDSLAGQLLGHQVGDLGVQQVVVAVNHHVGVEDLGAGSAGLPRPPAPTSCCCPPPTAHGPSAA